MTLLISDEDVKKILTFEETIEAVESAYRQYGLGLAGGNSLRHGCPLPPRCEMRIEGKNLPHMSPQIREIHQDMAYLEETGMILCRIGFYLGDKKGRMSILLNAKNGEILAVIKSSLTSWIRTGSAGAVGAKYLSRKNSKVAGIIGTGRQGRTQLPALTKVRDIEKAFAYSGRKRDEKYAQEMSRKLGIDVIACDNVAEVVKDTDILITATCATTPIIQGEMINEGLHINAMGADCPMKTELDALTLKKADKLVIDYELALDTKEIRIPMDQGLLRMEDIYGTIGEVVAGLKPGREKATEITIYKNTGMCLPYVAIYAKVYEKAIETGLGTDIGEYFSDLMYTF